MNDPDSLSYAQGIPSVGDVFLMRWDGDLRRLQVTVVEFDYEEQQLNVALKPIVGQE